MNNDLLPLIRSFDNVTEENCPSIESLRGGHVIALIFNQLSNNVQIDINHLVQIDKEKDDWINCLRNIKTIYNTIKEPLAAAKLTAPIDQMGIAKNNKPEQLANLLSMIFVYSLKGPKKDELMKKVKSLPKETQTAFKELISKQISRPSAPTTPRSTDSTNPTTTTPTKPAPSPTNVETPEMRTQRIRLELTLKKLEKDKTLLVSENSDLKAEKEKLQKSIANTSTNVNSSETSAQSAKIEEATNEKKREEEEIKNLDNEIAELEQFLEQKNKLQTEFEAMNARLRSLRQKANQSAPTIEGFRESTDPTAIKLLQEIDEAEKIIRPETAEKLRLMIAKLKKEINNATEDMNEKLELLGGPQALDTPKEGEGEDEANKESDNNDLSSSLSNEIDALTERNNQLNEEIVELMVKAEAIERMKNQHSFLEHVRSSSVFLKPE